MLQKGMLLKCKTTTKNDVFGMVLWEIVEIGLPAPEQNRHGKMDGVKVVMLGGSGPAAREGYFVFDSEEHIMQDVAAGVTQIVSQDKRSVILGQFKKNDCKETRHSGTGVVEL